MDREIFVNNVVKLSAGLDSAHKVADIIGCDIDCEGFIGDLIDGYGEMLLFAAVNYSGTLYEDLIEDFWNLIIDYLDEYTIKIEAMKFYDERIAANG